MSHFTDPSVGKRNAQRWFEPEEKDTFIQEVPAEWEAWLRGRRQDAPTEEELQRNLAVMAMKKKNAAELEQKYARERPQGLTTQIRKSESFPKYENEFEVMPGKKPGSKD